MKIIFISFLILMVFTACTTVLNVSSIPCDELDDAKDVLKRVFYSQTDKFNPNTFEINDNSVQWSKQRLTSTLTIFSEYNSASTVEYTNIIYFDMIQSCMIQKKQRHYELHVWISSQKHSFLLVLWDEETAIKGYSAFLCLKRSASK